MDIIQWVTKGRDHARARQHPDRSRVFLMIQANAMIDYAMRRWSFSFLAVALVAGTPAARADDMENGSERTIHAVFGRPWFGA
jgi:hypothetical protein